MTLGEVEVHQDVPEVAVVHDMYLDAPFPADKTPQLGGDASEGEMKKFWRCSTMMGG